MEILVFWVACCIGVGAVASSRGRSGIGWFLISLIISPLLGIIIVLAMQSLQPVVIVGGSMAVPARATYYDPEIGKKTTPPLTGVKKCPDCAEMVHVDARICRFCRHEFAEPRSRLGA